MSYREIRQRSVTHEGGLPGKEYVVIKDKYLPAIPLKVLIMNIVLRGIEPTLRHLTM